MAMRFPAYLRRILSRSSRLEVWFLEGDLATLRRSYFRDRAALKPHDDTALAELESAFHSEEQLGSDEIEYALTERLLRRARSLRLSYPSPRPRGFDPDAGGENWVFLYKLGQWGLSDEGETRLRARIRDEEKARREVAAFWFSSITTLLAVISGVFGARAGYIALQQKELARLDHQPRLECYVDRESLIVQNTGALVRRLDVGRTVFFDVKPFARPDSAQSVKYVLEGFYEDHLGEDYEGNQRVAFGMRGKYPNDALVHALVAGLVDSLQHRGLGWSGIEVGRLVRVVYWDWLGKREEAYYWATCAANETPESMERISKKRWSYLAASADSLRRSQRALDCRRGPEATTVSKVVAECIAATLRRPPHGWSH